MTKILVIEDETLLREQIAEQLGYEGFEVITAADGSQGLELAQRHQPDLIVSDIAMPGVDGYQVLWELQQQPQTATIPFIFLTAQAERTRVRYGMELGADDYVTKPFTSEELLGAIHTRLRKQEMAVRAAARELEPIRQRLAQTVSGGLRTPLASIMTTQRLLSRRWDELPAPQIGELLDTLQDGSHQLHHLVEQIVLVTQFETGVLSQEAIQAASTPTQVGSLLASAVSLAQQFAHRHSGRPVRLRVLDHQLVVRCHAPSLIHALAEPLANAIDYSPENGELTVSQWEKDNAVWIRIHDSRAGAGEAASATRESEPIDRDQPEAQDSGLGMPLARRIIEAHGGTLEQSLRAGKGTQVLIQLPLVQS